MARRRATGRRVLGKGVALPRGVTTGCWRDPRGWRKSVPRRTLRRCHACDHVRAHLGQGVQGALAPCHRQKSGGVRGADLLSMERGFGSSVSFVPSFARKSSIDPRLSKDGRRVAPPDRESARECVCVRERVCVCDRDRDRESVRESERESAVLVARRTIEGRPPGRARRAGRAPIHAKPAATTGALSCLAAA